MARLGVRLVLAAVGSVVFAAYLGAAALAVGVLAFVLVDPPDLFVALALFAATTLGAGYLSYRVGTAQLLNGLDALELTPARAPRLAASVERLADRMDVEPPRVLVAALGAPNALAFEAGDAVVLDRSLFDLLAPAELEGIVAHELAHLERRDGLVVTLAVSTARAVVGVTLLTLFPALLVVTGAAHGLAWARGRPAAWPETLPGRLRAGVERAVVSLLVVVVLLVRARGRRREFAADDRAAEVTGDPLALARALRKIEAAANALDPPASPDPRTGDGGRLGELLATHPSTDDRVERLLARAESVERATRIEVQ